MGIFKRDKVKAPPCPKCGTFMDKIKGWVCSRCGGKTIKRTVKGGK